MKIKKIHVSAFGKLMHFTMDFDDGFNVLYGVNEAGKSTLMYFIRVMFYGFNSNARKNNLADNDRERYRPWHSQLYGGTILFESGGRDYLLERHFGATKAKDTTRLANDVTGKEIRLSSPDEPGSELFGLGKTEFLKTVFVQQMSSVISEDENIKARLVSLIAGSEMQVSADQMKASLLEKRKKIINDRRNSQSEMGTLLDDKYHLEEELRTSYVQERLRRELTASIGDMKNQIAEQAGVKKSADKQLEADRQLKEIDQNQEILTVWGRVEQASADLAILRQPDTCGRVVPAAADIETAERLIEHVEQIDSKLTMLGEQAEAIRKDMAELPSPDQLRRRLDTIAERENEWQAIEDEKTALDQEEKGQVGQFDLKDRELERLLSQATLSQATVKSTSESMLNVLAAARSDAFHQKSALGQNHQQKKDEIQRRMRELVDKTAEDQGHLRDAEQLLEQEGQILAGQKNHLANQQALLAQMIQQHEGNESQKAVARKTSLPVWAIVGTALLLLGLAAVALGQQVWPWLAMLIGLVLIAVQFMLRSSRQRSVQAAVRSADLAYQIQSQEFQVKTLDQQIAGQSLKVSNLERDIGQYRCKLGQYEQELSQAEAFGSDSAWETDMVRQLDELENIVNQLDAEISAQKASSVAEQERLAASLAEIQEKKTNHRFCLADEFITQKNSHAARSSAWYESVRALGVDSREHLQSVKVDLLQKQAAYQSKSGALASIHTQVQAETDKRQTLMDQLTQIGQGYFADASIAGMKERLQLAVEADERINNLSIEKNHLLERVQAGSGGKTKAELEVRIAENQSWIATQAPETARLSEVEVLQVRQDQISSQEALQACNMQLGRLTTQLAQFEQTSRLPVEIQREIVNADEKLASCQSDIRSIDLAIQMIAEADDEMRQTFGPIINTRTAEYLAGLTGINNQLIRVENDFNVQVEDPVTHQYKAHDFFSSGKVDQIYLALRLAITDAVYTKEGAENLPFSFDDILVQYDQQKGRQAVDFLVDISKKQQRQMIFITCHDHIRQYCQARNCHVIDLDQPA